MKNNDHQLPAICFKFCLLTCFLFFSGISEALAQASTQYCTTNLYFGGCTAGDRIDRFKFASIDNINNTCGLNGYSDYTSMSASVMRNTTHTVEVYVSPALAHGYAVWVDWNQDQDFDDVGELVYTTSNTNIHTHNINIPSYALLGQTRLRVRSVKNALLVASSACTQFAFGETEDYTINVVANTNYCTNIHSGCSNEYIHSVVFNTIINNSSCSFSGYANYTNISTTVQMGSTYPIGVSTMNSSPLTKVLGVWIDYNNDGDFDDVGEFVSNLSQTGGPLSRNITIPQNIIPGNKRMRVRFGNTHVPFEALDACKYIPTGETEDYTLNVIGQTDYCTIGLYQQGCSSLQSNVNIATVAFAGISNPSGCSPNGFGDFTHLVANVQPGTKYPITVNTGSPNQAIGVWIDFNRDFNFNDTDEFVYQSALQASQVFSDSIFIPATMPIGGTRMRIRTFSTNVQPQANQACIMGFTGETEDYTVTIMPPPGPVDVGVSGILGPKTSCGLGSAETVAVVVKNYGTTSQSNFPVNYLVSGGTSVSQVVSRTIAPGDTIHVNFATKANLSTVSTFLLKSWTDLSADAQPLNDSSIVSIMNSGNGISTFPYTENFDSFVSSSANGGILAGYFQNGWTNATNDDTDWKVSSATTRQINPALGPVGDHTTGSANFLNVFFTTPSGYTANLESPCFDFTSLNNPTLEFWYHMYDTSPGSLAVDVNVGGRWDLNVYQLTAPVQGTRNDPWAKITVSLLPYAGKVVRLRFRALSGSSGVIALDDIGILNPPLPVHNIGVSAFNSPQTGCSLKATENVCIQVTNHGNQPASNFPVTYQLNNLPPVTQQFAGTPLPPGASVSFCFATKADLSVAGTYQLKAFATLPGDTNHANDTTQAVITNTLPDLNFTYTPTAAQTYQFTAQQAGTGNFTWNFGDGNTSTLPNPTHQYRTAGTYTVKLTGPSANGCTGEVQQTISVISGMKELAETVFKIFPNPATEKITIKLSGEERAKHIALISVLGVTLKEISLPAGTRETSFQVSDLPAGSYFIRVTTKSGNFVRPVILSR